jgi:hypothetical protein
VAIRQPSAKIDTKPTLIFSAPSKSRSTLMTTIAALTRVVSRSSIAALRKAYPIISSAREQRGGNYDPRCYTDDGRPRKVHRSYLLQKSSMLLQTDRIFVALLTICVLGFIVDRIFRLLVDKVLARYMSFVSQT